MRPKFIFNWESWRRSSERDYGLSFNAAFVFIYNLGLSLMGPLFCKKILFQSLLVLFFHALVFIYKEKFLKMGEKAVFLVHSFGLLFFMWFNYEVIGKIDLLMGGLPLYDNLMLEFEIHFFKNPISIYIEDHFRSWHAPLEYIYDLLMVSYMIYYFLPFHGIYRIYQNTNKKNLFFVSRYTSSYIFLFAITFAFYLLIPVTGPLYFLKEFFLHPLPFTQLGHSLFYFVYALHPTFIDCFPSGHTGVALLSVLWAFRLNFTGKFVLGLIAFAIVLSTLALRFHYMLDVLAAVPLVLISYYLSKIFFPKAIWYNS